jgi:hypothetical protein
METSHDLLPQIATITRDAIRDGLITETTVYEFDTQVAVRNGPELEDYIQALWDQL